MKFVLLFASTLLCFSITAQQIENVRFEQEGKKVNVYYDITGATGQTFTVSLYVSEDNGTTWQGTLNNLTGDAGEKISGGLNKKIVWDVLASRDKLTGENIMFEVRTTVVEPVETTDYDGNKYKTVKIGTQVWFAENLKTTHYRDGSAIPNVSDKDEWRNLTTGAYCNYDNSASNANTYGRLYNWYAVNDSRKLCPFGWHVPTDADWKTLEMALGMSQTDADIAGWRGTNEGGKLKETGTTHWNYQNTGATNSIGFSALPGGYRYLNGSFFNIGLNGHWWTATEYDTSSAWRRSLGYSSSGVGRSDDDKEYGFSVRCIRDY